jgi:TolB-like protein/predicted Ser/Thr protein kinase
MGSGQGMIGTRLSHYRIDGRLGEGGMGEVFLAQDLALGRPVAIKVLPASFSPEMRRRLLREAETSRRLQHPGIATFFEAGLAGDQAFIAMEYVQGETLRERLRHGALPTQTALGVAAGLLEALGHAHGSGIVHRDIKPENVMITPAGIVKLLDFGVARHVTRSDTGGATIHSTLVTEPGTLIGSIGYMAPEQLQSTPVDHRADLFAVGAVLYEMLAGRPAFEGATPAARIAATLFSDPPPLPRSAQEVDGIVRHALARPREQRYASASEFLRDLRRLGEGRAVAAYPDTLAVLDFENRSGSPDDAWIGTGIAENLVADLGRFSGIGIVPRPKVLRVCAGGNRSDPAAAGALLGCRWVLSGSYQKMGETLRMLMQLTHVPTEHVITSEKLDGRMDEIFTMQDQLGRRAAEALELREQARDDALPAPPSLGAYECYTRGLEKFIRMTKGGFDQAEELYQEAIDQQSGYPDALAGLAAIHDLRFTFTTDRAELETALRHAHQAVAGAPGHAAAHVWLGYALWRRGETGAGIAAEERAGELDATNHYPPYFQACMRLSRGEVEASVPLYQSAVKLAPGFGFAWVGLGHAHMQLGHFDEAGWALARAIELEQNGFHATAGAAGYLGECMRRQGQFDEARRLCLAGIEAVERTDHMYRDSFRAICLNVLGRTAIEQGHHDAARTAFHQCELHLGGRPRTLGGGPLTCQALAGRAIVDEDGEVLTRAIERFERRDELDWSWLWQCDEEVARMDLARAAKALGRERDLGRLEEKAVRP